MLIEISRIILVPLPTYRLASAALRSLNVDAELSPFVRRSFSLGPENSLSYGAPMGQLKDPNSHQLPINDSGIVDRDTEDLETLTVLRVVYKATSNRMLRVAVNGYMESLGVVLGVMQELDVDVLSDKG